MISRGRRLMIFFLLVAALLCGNHDVIGADAQPEMLPAVKRVVFLGDSITYAGGYVELIDAYFATRFPDRKIQFLDIGLPSETVSGLSEPGHAGGKFPRPDLHERLGRVLIQSSPDLVIACYGMNDGIYYPFGEERFEKYKAGIIRLRQRATEAGAKIIHVTPPVFDPMPIKTRTLPAGLTEYRQPYEGYNEVLDRYSDWLLSQRSQGWEVVDMHGPMNRFLAEHRKENPTYTLAGDGVHPNSTGHWIIAKAILEHLGAKDLSGVTDAKSLMASHPKGEVILRLVEQRQRILKDAWLTQTGHQRPGMKPGMPLKDAESSAAVFEKKISEER